MASRTGSLQGLATQAIQSFFARRIGTAVYQADRKNAEATLAELPFTQQEEYARVGVFVQRLTDARELRAGLYAGADAIVQGGIGSLTPRQRVAAVGMFTRAFMAMKRQMNGTAPVDEADLMKALVEADQQAGADAQPVNTKPAPLLDLAAMQTEGVQ